MYNHFITFALIISKPDEHTFDALLPYFTCYHILLVTIFYPLYLLASYFSRSINLIVFCVVVVVVVLKIHI